MENGTLTLEEILREYMLCPVEINLTTGAKFTGYLLDIKLPVVNEIMFYFLESNKAKRYLAKYNPTWLTPLPFFMIKTINLLEDDEFTERLIDHRMGFYHPESQ